MFYLQTQPIRVTATNVVMEYNSFLSTDIIPCMHKKNFPSLTISGIQQTHQLLNHMIYDGRDDYRLAHYIQYTPFLTQPHPDTPIPDFNQTPTAECGSDRIVFESVSPDGSASIDPDGSIVGYYWKLSQKSDPTTT